VAQAADVEVAAARDRGARNLLLQQPADHVQLALEGGLVRDVLSPADEDLADDRLARLGGGSERGVAGGHFAPAEQLLPLRAHGLLEEAVDSRLPGLAGREEDHAHPIAAGGRQLDPELVAFLGEEGVRRLQEDAGAVAGVLLGAGSAAVLEVEQHLERFHHDVVRRAALDVGDESEATGVVLECRVVESLRWRKSHRFHVGPFAPGA